MPNLSYQRSRRREYQVKDQFEKDNWFAIRASGSHGIADVVAIRPTKCGHPDHFEVKFIQIKTSKYLKNDSKTIKVEETPFGSVNVEYFNYASINPKRTKMERDKAKEKRLLRSKNKVRKSTSSPTR